ncbi:uncharacterized protein LOC108667433 [Hyalella azteca]|uniref:Uncharacterized protein LOC108667433 n=1 Tax=Hyalella azteca TaxID=294128 RepID=A0A8B7N8J2_HYAAZ|nr:uncharacterized protein LOC108667433 [Hyalella azteca]
MKNSLAHTMQFWLVLLGLVVLPSLVHSQDDETWPKEESFPITDVDSSMTPVAEARYADEDYFQGDDAQARDYKPAKPHCHPHTVTKYRTVFKDRKANVFNKVEVRNPRPQVHKTKETRHTTIRYPVFITQVIKPLLTQVETKVKPMFFTKTLKRIKTIVFTVTGIGQVTVTSVKYEKEYVTRCQKKGGYGHGHGGHKGGHHRREDQVEPEYAYDDYPAAPTYGTSTIDTPEELYVDGRRGSSASRHRREIDLAPSMSEVEAEATSYVTNPLPTSATATA